MIKDAQALEVAHRVDTVAFDKTGTLTLGRPRLTAFVAAPGVDERQALAHAARLQSGSEHPLARALVEAAGADGSAPELMRAVVGCGVEGEVDGRQYLIGSLHWMAELGVSLAPLHAQIAAAQAEGATLSVLTERTPQGLQARALMAFADQPKPEAGQALASLRAAGLRIVMISGDNRAAALAMAQRLGLHEDEVHAEVLPGDKAALVARLQAQGRVVAMVGDGINDAPALAAADVGLAMGSGTDVAMHAAGITLMRGDLALVAGALDISRRTVAKIRQNLFWAFAYNVAGIPLAALGLLSPVLAGAAMALSSLSVLGNALLLKRWRPPQPGSAG